MTVRLALLGVAHVHALGYAALLRDRDDVHLLGFSETDPELARIFAAHSGLKALPLEELLKARPDGVIVCSETAHHLPLVEAAAAAGAHVLCEKPIAVTDEQAQAMNQVCRAAGVQFVTAFPARFSPDVQRLRQQLQGGGLGSVLTYSGVNHSVAPDHEHPWFGDLLLAGGGAGMDHIVHLADLLRHFGEQPAEVYARFLPVPAWVHADHADIDAAGLVLLRLTSGATASIDCSWSRPRGYPRWGHLQLNVVAAFAMLSLDVFAQTLNVSGAAYRWAGYGPDLNALMLADFIRVCGDARPGRADWQDGYEALKIVHAAYDSAAADQPVRLNAPPHSPA
ncbi:Gfo/Idh/MocA family oxidoreductase (plasmid) [Deinococcus sp. KNUC1210]|uniref:Gfo/Idh/MocA family protein n=1 Tax=Deinococcus sp. KNUC1210 TaxID=2917691 RepID=UPI001EF0957E|nr:Gfo/Idh/MocA family oxidoreductase [Deinococcus sp. KNUC1210]ULH17616.1 Gfo/Idh/MocA family oxidoreductase [Deinococcus sp. KNUC1210]